MDNQLITVTSNENLLLSNIIDKKKELDKCMKKIHAEFLKVEKAKLNSAFILLRINDYELFQNDEMSYKSIYDFCSEICGLSKATVSECLTVARVFGKYDIDNDTGKFIPTYTLLEDFKDFNFSQLYAMRSLSFDYIKDNITPDMSVKCIKGIVNNSMQNALTDNIDPLPFSDEMNEPEEEEDADVEKVAFFGTITLEQLENTPLKLPRTDKGYIVKLNNDSIIIEAVS